MVLLVSRASGLCRSKYVPLCRLLVGQPNGRQPSTHDVLETAVASNSTAAETSGEHPLPMSAAELSFKRSLERTVNKKMNRKSSETSRGRWLGLLFAVLTVSIYVYTLSHMKKETFLEDLEELEDPRQYKQQTSS